MMDKIENFIFTAMFLLTLTSVAFSYHIENKYNTTEVHSVGRYALYAEKIELACKDRTNIEIEETFYHEAGHHIYYDSMSRSKREAWDLIVETYPDDALTKYAKTDNEEDFAETYMKYRMNDCPMDNPRCIFAEKMYKKYVV